MVRWQRRCVLSARLLADYTASAINTFSSTVNSEPRLPMSRFPPGCCQICCQTAQNNNADPLGSAQVTDLIGGADEDRTHDLLNAIQALSQTELRPHLEQVR
jgi:hypothetical protein